MSDRKYRHRGYRDDDSASEPRSSGRPAERRGGRGLGKPTATAFRCAVCGTRQEAGELASDAECRKCGADLHTCTHCVHFDTSAPLDCRQKILHRIGNKAKRNTCEHFEPKAAQEFASDTSGGTQDARAAFDALFKNL